VLPQKVGVLPTDWLFYEEMTRAGKGSYGGLACVRCCTVVSPATVAIFAGPSKLPSDALKDTADEVAGITKNVFFLKVLDYIMLLYVVTNPYLTYDVYMYIQSNHPKEG
jgi:hypothetical protein